MRRHHAPHEQRVVGGDPRFVQVALELRVAFGDARRADFTSAQRSQAEAIELVLLGTAAVADPHHRVQQVPGRQADHALSAGARASEWLRLACQMYVPTRS